jgi:hypothetical protein
VKISRTGGETRAGVDVRGEMVLSRPPICYPLSLSFTSSVLETLDCGWRWVSKRIVALAFSSRRAKVDS